MQLVPRGEALGWIGSWIAAIRHMRRIPSAISVLPRRSQAPRCTITHSVACHQLCNVALITGCATKPYQYGGNYPHDDQNLSPPMQTQVIVGEPHGFLDHSDWIWPGSLLGKLLLWDKDIDSHTISPETLDAMQAYMDANNLDDIAIALHEAAHAKDFSRRKYKGLNAAIYALPGAPLHYEAVASNDALGYLDQTCEFAEEKSAYRTLHPAYGTYVGGTFPNGNRTVNDIAST